MKIPISVISGYLGAGKTTLLKRIIGKLDRRFAILMNEFGDIGIDTDIIKGKNINVKELLGGCVCCSLTGEFEEAVKEILKEYDPEIIIVETTGVAEPDALIFEISENLKDVKIDSVICVADADAVLKFPVIGRTGIVQLEMADIIVLNKIDLVNKEELENVKGKIKMYNEKAPIVEAKYCDVDIDLLFGIEVEHHVKEIHHVHKTKFEYFTCKFDKKINRNKFEKWLKKLSKEVYRLKGFVPFEDGCYLVNYVNGRYDLEKKEGRQEIVFIGERIEKLKDKIINEFQKI